MCSLKKMLKLWFIVTIVCLVIPGQLQSWDVSACGGCSNPDADPDAVGFYNAVSGFPSWTANFYRKYTNCLETYYKRSGSGGSENSWIDTSHIHYHVSHGGSHWDSYYRRYMTAVIFDTSSSATDPKYLDASEARGSWGDNTLNWIGFRCCTLLNNRSWKKWSKAMNNLHLILGFRTVSYVDNSFGSKWANSMRQGIIVNIGGPIAGPLGVNNRQTGTTAGGPIQVNFTRTITQAWNWTVDLTQPITVESRVIAETYNCYSDHLPGSGSACSDPTPDSWKWRWDHRSLPFGFIFLVVNTVNDVVDYQVIPREVNEEYVREIGEAFGFGPDHAVEEAEDYFFMASPDEENPDPSDPDNPVHLLTVFKNTGMYYYQDLGKLWKVNQDDPEDPDIPEIFPEEEAHERAYGFLTNPAHINLLPADAIPIPIIGGDVIVKENVDTLELVNFPIEQCVAYARAVDVQAGIPANVFGPGARLKVYIDSDGDIIGAMGHWQEVEPVGTVDVISKEDAWALFEENGQGTAVAPVYIEYESVKTDLNTATIGYYEHSALTTQTQLIPVWVFNTEYYNEEGELVLTAYTHIPAAIQR